MKAVFTSHNNINWSNDATYFYYLHGPLARVEIGDKKVQGLDYAYTIQGWLKSVNGAAIDATQDIGKDGIAGSQYIPEQPTILLPAQADIHKHVGRDAFAYSLHYFTGDYAAINTDANHQFLGNLSAIEPNTNLAAANLYNGNIKMRTTGLMHWAGTGEATPLPVTITNYRYDQLNRIKQASYRYADNNQYANLSNTNEYKTSYTYDGNGNIKTLDRNGSTAKGLVMDDLTYYYDLNSNRLLYVSETATDHAGYDDIKQDETPYNFSQPITWQFQYDPIGNMISERKEGIENIDWSVYGKIKSISRISGFTKNGVQPGDLDFAYDAMSNRVMKTYKRREAGQLTNEDEWTSTYYVRDAQGNVMATYEKSYTHETNGSYTVHLKQLDNIIYGSSRLGVYQNTVYESTRNFTITGFTNHKFAGRVYNSTPGNEQPCLDPVCPVRYSSSTGLKQYELNDHLGNVQTVVSDNIIGVDEGTDGTADYFRAHLLNVTDYYPFGSEMPDRISGNKGYRYGFNGKENDNEVKGEGNQLDFGARMYDSRLGRFFSPDPREKDFPWQSTYAFASNNPIVLIDFNGEGSEDPISKQVKHEDGSYQGILIMGDGNTGTKKVEGKTYDITAFTTNLVLSISGGKKEVGFLIIKDSKGNMGFLIENSSKNDATTSYHDPTIETDPTTKKTYVTIENQKYEVVAYAHNHINTNPNNKTDYANIPSFADQQLADATGRMQYIIGPEFVSRIKKGDDNDLTSNFINKSSGGHSEYFKITETEKLKRGQFSLIKDAKKPTPIKGKVAPTIGVRKQNLN